MFTPIELYAPIDKRPKSSPFHGEVTGSNPVGSTICRYGGMADALVLGTSIGRCAGSSPVAGTREARESKELVLRTTAYLEKQICNISRKALLTTINAEVLEW